MRGRASLPSTRGRGILPPWSRILTIAFLILASGNALSRAGGNLETIAGGQIINITWSRLALPITWKMNELGLPNNCNNGNPDCVGGVSPMTLQRTIDAFTAAFNTWQAVPTSTIAFTYAGTTATATTGVDGLNIVTFSDSTNCTTVGVVASTPSYSLAAPLTVGPTTRDVNNDGIIDLDPTIYPDGTVLPAGTIIDADTAFCPDSFDYTDVPIDSPSPMNVLDVVAVATHELGHFHGLSHASLSTPLPTMFPFVDFTAAWGADASVPAQDDIAATSRYYPESTFGSSFGTITGRVFYPGGTTPADGISVAAYNKATGEMTVQVYSVSRFTATADPAGFFRIDGLPPGTYYIAAEYFDGSATGTQTTANDDSWWDNDRYNYTIYNSNVTGVNVKPAKIVRPEFLSSPENSTDDLAPPIAVTVGAGQTVAVPSIIINTDAPAAPAGATALNLPNSTYVQVVFPAGFTFPFYGQPYSSVFIGDNANLTFGFAGTTSGDTRNFLGPSAGGAVPPRIAVGLADLDPGVDNTGGKGGPPLDVWYQFIPDAVAGDRVEITYLGIPLVATNKSCTAIVRLFKSGRVEIQYRFWGAWWGVAGICPGGDGTEPAVSLDISHQLPFSGGSGAALYEHFGFAQHVAMGGDDTFAPAFDLGGSLLIFTQNAQGGYDLTSPELAVHPPGEIQNLRLSAPTALVWDARPDAVTYDVYRGSLGSFVDTNGDGAAESYGTCLDPALTLPGDTDVSIPAAGSGYFYLVTGKNNAGEGTLGVASSGATRPNAQPCP